MTRPIYRESHPAATAVAGALLFAASVPAKALPELAAVFSAAVLIAAAANVRIIPTMRRLWRLIALSTLTVAVFLLVLLVARHHGQGRALDIPAGQEIRDAVAVPALRLVCGAVAALCIVIPFLGAGGLRRVLTLGLPQSAALLILSTIANLYVFRASIERVITAHHAAGSLDGRSFARLREIPDIAVRVWAAVAIWLTDAYDFKWMAHDVPALAQAYGRRVAGRYGAMRSVAVVICGLAPAIFELSRH